MATYTSYDPVMKQIYRPELVEMLVNKNRVLTAFMPKKETYKGRNTPVPLMYTNTQGLSHTFSTAQNNVTDSGWEDFLITTGENHSLAHISSKVVAGTADKPASFVPALKTEIDSAMNALSDGIESEIPRDGSGALGQISSGSTVSSGTITLADVNDIVNFEVGMTLVSSGTTTGAVRTGSEVVAAIDRTAGTLDSTSAAWNTVATNIAPSDYLFRQGDANNNDSDKALNGFQDWLPTAQPSSGESFFGVDRSVDSRLWGVYDDQSSATTIEEAIIDHESKIAQWHEGHPDHYMLNNGQMRRLKKEVGVKKEYEVMTASGAQGLIAKLSFKAVVVDGDSGPLKVLAAPRLPSTMGVCLQRNTWELGSLGPLVRFDDTDGKRILRRSSASGVEVRCVSWAQVVCKAPGWNGRSLLPAVS